MKRSSLPSPEPPVKSKYKRRDNDTIRDEDSDNDDYVPYKPLKERRRQEVPYSSIVYHL